MWRIWMYRDLYVTSDLIVCMYLPVLYGRDAGWTFPKDHLMDAYNVLVSSYCISIAWILNQLSWSMLSKITSFGF